MPITTITIKDKNYPKLLKQIKDRPNTLYLKGEMPIDETCFAIVGTRRNSFYGKQAVLEIAGDLAEAGLTIVSGLAPGIDTFCHQAVLERNKRTIAVLGTGLDTKSIYPRTNLRLAAKIIETGGCLISEYPVKSPGSKITFPARNRIISGLSIGVLIIEAKQKSGALITAAWAKKQGRKIFALPGSIYSSNSKGCHCLIKQGAKLVESANDILKELNIKDLIFHSKDRLAGENKEENLILETLKQGPLDIDKIIERTKLSTSTVTGCLAIMEINSKVKNLGRNIYAITHR
ncbi:MAG: DNA-processing protein DprA [Candidatus Nealsonbacteria bacterium]|nr:DNA-processing protein DprA [Candidatus Nealsonbacteria bacterium]